MNDKVHITVETLVNAPIELVWKLWATPGHITKWNFATDSWCCPRAENNLQLGGAFNWRMEATDGRSGFDFTGTYKQIIANELITYEMTDGREVTIRFLVGSGWVNIIETFEAETINSEDLQRAGWQAILDNFKKYAESVK